MTVYYAMNAGGNWIDAGMWNTEPDGTGSGGSPGAGDVANLNGLYVNFDAATDQSILGGFPGCLVTGGIQISFNDTTASGSPIVFGDGAAFDSGVAVVTDGLGGGYSTSGFQWVRFSTDMSLSGSVPISLGDGTVCVITATQSGSFQAADDGGVAPVILLAAAASVPTITGAAIIPVLALVDPSTVTDGTTYAIASGYSGPGGMVGTAATGGGGTVVINNSFGIGI